MLQRKCWRTHGWDMDDGQASQATGHQGNETKIIYGFSPCLRVAVKYSSSSTRLKCNNLIMEIECMRWSIDLFTYCGPNGSFWKGPSCEVYLRNAVSQTCTPWAIVRPRLLRTPYLSYSCPLILAWRDKCMSFQFVGDLVWTWVGSDSLQGVDIFYSIQRILEWTKPWEAWKWHPSSRLGFLGEDQPAELGHVVVGAD